MNIKQGERNIRVSFVCLYLRSRLDFAELLLHSEATRYTNPLKQKFKAKRTAAEGALPLFVSSPISHFLTYLCIYSRWSSSTCCPKTTQRPNARRVPSSQQNPLLTEPPRNLHERTTSGTIQPISKPVRSSSYPYQKGHRVCGIYGRGERGGGKGCTAQFQVGWGEQDKGPYLCLCFSFGRQI